MRDGMAKAYTLMEEYNKAIKVQEVCMQQLNMNENSFPKHSRKGNIQIHHVLGCLGLCYTRLGGGEKGLSLCRKALGYSNPCNTCTLSILAYLNAQERHLESMALLKELGEIISEVEITPLSECLMSDSRVT